MTHPPMTTLYAGICTLKDRLKAYPNNLAWRLAAPQSG